MMKRILVLSILSLSLLLPSVSGARDRDKQGGKGPWIHIEVLENGEEGASVKVNLPLSMARIALEMAPEEVLSEGRIQIDDEDFTVDDLRRMWKELRNAGDAEFVTVKEGDESVRVFRKGDRIFVQTDADEDEDEMVRVEVPVALVDALLSGTGDELDLDAAVKALEGMGKSDIVLVRDGEDTVRIWVD